MRVSPRLPGRARVPGHIYLTMMELESWQDSQSPGSNCGTSPTSVSYETCLYRPDSQGSCCEVFKLLRDTLFSDLYMDHYVLLVSVKNFNICVSSSMRHLHCVSLL